MQRDSKEMETCKQDVPRHRQHRHRTRFGSTDGTPCSDRTPARLNHRVTTSWTSRTVGLWEAFIYRDRVLLLDSFTWTALHDPVVALSILYTRKYIIHESTCTHLGQNMVPGDPPKGQSASPACVHGSTISCINGDGKKVRKKKKFQTVY